MGSAGGARPAPRPRDRLPRPRLARDGAAAGQAARRRPADVRRGTGAAGDAGRRAALDRRSLDRADRARRAALLALGVQAGARRGRRGAAARPVARRRHLRAAADRRARRDLRRVAGTALPARADLPGRVPAGRVRDAELPDPGTEHRHALPRGPRARVPRGPVDLRLPGRLRGPPARARARHRGRRSRRPPRRRGRPRVAFAGVAPRRRRSRRMVTWLERGDLRLGLVPELGGRLLSVRHRGVELLWRNPALLGDDLRGEYTPNSGRMGDWVNYGGDKTWPAPQGWDDPDQWPGPPDPVLDSGPYTAVADGDTVTMTSAPDPRTGLRL